MTNFRLRLSRDLVEKSFHNDATRSSWKLKPLCSTPLRASHARSRSRARSPGSMDIAEDYHFKQWSGRLDARPLFPTAKAPGKPRVGQRRNRRVNGYVSQQGTCDKKINTPSSTLQSILHDQKCRARSIGRMRSRKLNLACRKTDRRKTFRVANIPCYQMSKSVNLSSRVSRLARRIASSPTEPHFQPDAKNRRLSASVLSVVSRCQKPSDWLASKNFHCIEMQKAVRSISKFVICIEMQKTVSVPISGPFVS